MRCLAREDVMFQSTRWHGYVVFMGVCAKAVMGMYRCAARQINIAEFVLCCHVCIRHCLLKHLIPTRAYRARTPAAASWHTSAQSTHPQQPLKEIPLNGHNSAHAPRVNIHRKYGCCPDSNVKHRREEKSVNDLK